MHWLYIQYTHSWVYIHRTYIHCIYSTLLLSKHALSIHTVYMHWVYEHWIYTQYTYSTHELSIHVTLSQQQQPSCSFHRCQHTPAECRSLGSVGAGLIPIPFIYPPPRHLPTPSERCPLDTKRCSTDAVTGDDQTGKWTLLHLKYAEKKASCDNTAQQVFGALRKCSLSRHRKGAGLVSQARTEIGSGVIIITAININVWIPLLSTHLDDLIMGSLQVWLVKCFQNKIASSNLDFLDEMPPASSSDRLSWSWKQAAIPF